MSGRKSISDNPFAHLLKPQKQTQAVTPSGKHLMPSDLLRTTNLKSGIARAHPGQLQPSRLRHTQHADAPSKSLSYSGTCIRLRNLR